MEGSCHASLPSRDLPNPEVEPVSNWSLLHWQADSPPPACLRVPQVRPSLTDPTCKAADISTAPTFLSTMTTQIPYNKRGTGLMCLNI